MDYLEPEYKDAYESWAEDNTPEGNAAMLQAIDPVVQKGASMYGGGQSPLTRSRARKLALKSLATYDRSRSRLQSHLLNQMQGLRRISQQQHAVIHTPERVMLDSHKLHRHTQELHDELGREPTDNELANKAGVSLKRIKYVREWQPGLTTGQLAAADPEGSPRVNRLNQNNNAWLEVVYDSLPSIDQKIMEWSLGLHGHEKLSNKEIASKLSRSPGAISQRKAKIQQIIRQEETLSPFME